MYRLIFIFLFISSLGYSQENTQKYETDTYFITYPKQFTLNEDSSNFIIRTAFIIDKCDSTTGFNEPIIQLTIGDYSRTGMGPWTHIKDQEKGKVVTKHKTKFNKTDFDRISYQDEYYEIIEYIFLKENVVYNLKGFLLKGYEAEFKTELEGIMESFDLK